MTASTPSIEIAQATFADLPLVVPLFDAYRQFYGQSSDLTGAHRFLQAHLEKQTSVIFLAFAHVAGGQRQASGFTQLYPSFSSVSMQPLWILNDLFVAPEARTLGAGTALLEHAKAYAIQTGAKGLTLTTQVNNLVAQRVYENAGWQRDQEFYTYTMYV
jgi:GNAT superfamily N-acetyltransferase